MRHVPDSSTERRDDIVCPPAGDAPEHHHQRRARVDLGCQSLRQLGHDPGRRMDRVDGLVGPGSVAAGAFDQHFEPV